MSARPVRLTVAAVIIAAGAFAFGAKYGLWLIERGVRRAAVWREAAQQ